MLISHVEATVFNHPHHHYLGGEMLFTRYLNLESGAIHMFLLMVMNVIWKISRLVIYQLQSARGTFSNLALKKILRRRCMKYLKFL